MTQQRFPAFSRILHWLMALMIISMLFIGIGMMASLTDYHWLLAIHRPLGIAILVLVSVRLVNRLVNPPPRLPHGLPPVLRLAANGSHGLLYGLMIAQPLIGWGMLSAGGYPIVLYGALELPPILPQSDTLYASLREAHTVLALILFATILTHLGAALMHALVFRDGVFESMASVSRGSGEASVPEKPAKALGS